MTSELRVTTLSNATGDGPATLTQQSAPKAFIFLNAVANTIASDSLNFSSVTDVSTGLSDLFFTNNFSSSTYSNPGSAEGGTGTQSVVCSWYNGGQAYRSTSANSIGVRNLSDNALTDRGYVVLIYCGDLA